MLDAMLSPSEAFDLGLTPGLIAPPVFTRFILHQLKPATPALQHAQQFLGTGVETHSLARASADLIYLRISAPGHPLLREHSEALATGLTRAADAFQHLQQRAWRRQ